MECLDMKNNSSSKKTSYITRGAMILLTTILIILFFCIMLLVSQIQGTARIVNYAGLVRGKTQRIIKLEDAGQPHDEMIDSVSSYIKGCLSPDTLFQSFSFVYHHK